jgi:hypothetical protein
LLAFHRLAADQRATWKDVVSGLEYRGLVAEHAMLLLHRRLAVPQRDGSYIPDREFWIEHLRVMGKSLEENARENRGAVSH